MNEPIRFTVGLNGADGNLETLMHEFGNRIYEVFAAAPPDIIGTGRRGHRPMDKMTLETQIAYAHSHDVRYNVLLNSGCVGGTEFSPAFRNTLRDFIRFLEDVEADCVTISNAYLIEFVRSFSSIPITAGSWNYIDSMPKTRRFDLLGVDYIVPHDDIVRSFSTLKSMQKAFRGEMKIIANQGCLYQCDTAHAHNNMTSHTSNCTDQEFRAYGNALYPIIRCRTARAQNPLEFLMCGFIRPEEISVYVKQGFSLFKLAGRRAPTEWMVNTVRAYLDQSYDGNIFDLFSQFVGVQSKPNIPNKELDGWIEFCGDSIDETAFIAKCKEFYYEKNFQRYFKEENLCIESLSLMTQEKPGGEKGV